MTTSNAIMGHCAEEIIGKTDDKLHKKKLFMPLKMSQGLRSGVKIIAFQIQCKFWRIIATIMHFLLEIFNFS